MQIVVGAGHCAHAVTALRRMSRRGLFRFGIALIVIALASATLLLVADTAETGYGAGDTRYLPQRFGLALLTQVDFPLLELLIIGVFCLARSLSIRNAPSQADVA